MRLPKLSDILTAKDSSEISLDDLRQQIGTLAAEDKRFTSEEDDDTHISSRPWTDNILFADGEWSAVIVAVDGKLWKVGFTVEDGAVKALLDDAKEVKRKTEYVAASEPFKFNGNPVEDSEGDVVKCGAPIGNQNAAGKHDILSERGNAHSAQKAVFTAPNHEAGVLFGQKASDAANKASKLAAINNSEHSNLHAGRAHTHAREAHEELARLAPDKKTEKFHMGEAAKHAASEATHLGAIGLKAKGSTVGIPTPKNSEESEVVVCKDAGSPISTEKKWEFGKPVEFMWAPGGKTVIQAGCAGRTLKIWVMGDQKGAKDVQASFVAAVAASPRRVPFGCVEHEEKERAFEPKKFLWKDEPEPGIYCSAVPTKLGETNVNGKLQTSFSPCFRHDAKLSQAVCQECSEKASVCECGGVLEFPEGVRGSESNPAHITGVFEKSVGSLTNWPAFKDILPVTAKEPAPAPVIKGAEAEGGKKTKHADKAKEAATSAYHAMNQAELEPKVAKEHATEASEHAEKATGHAADAKDHEKAHAHHWAGKAHEHAANAQSRAGTWQQESHHRAQAELHRRYATASKDEAHPEHSRAMNFKASEPTKPTLDTIYAKHAKPQPEKLTVEQIYARKGANGQPAA